ARRCAARSAGALAASHIPRLDWRKGILGKRMKRILMGVLGAALMLGAAGAAETKLPSRDHFLFWTPAEQAFGYKTIEKIFPVRVVKRGATVSPLPHDPKPFDVSYKQDGKTFDTAAFMKANRSSGLIIISHGKVLLERYGLGRTEKD